jgi:hypothetical protein
MSPFGCTLTTVISRKEYGHFASAVAFRQILVRFVTSPLT